MKKKLLYFLFFFIAVSCKNNKKEVITASDPKDSLAFFFEAANNDSIPYEKRHVYADKIVAKIEVQQNDSMNRINYFKAANRYYNMNALNDYKKLTKVIVQRTADAKDTIGLAKAYTYLADYYANKFVSDSAYMYYFNAEKLYRRLKDYPKTAKTILNKSIIQLNEKDYIGSEKSAFECLKILRKTNDNDLTYSTYNILGIIYNELSEYDKSIEFHNKALELITDKKITESSFAESGSLNNIGLIYQNKKNDKKAIQYFNKALVSPNLLKLNPFQYSAIIDNLGYSKFEIGDFNNLPDLFYKSLKIVDSLKVNTSIVSCKLHLSEYYAFKKDTLKAVNFATGAYDLAKTNNLTKDILSSLKQLSAVNPKKISIYSKEYIKINDSLQIAERKVRNKLARIEFETEELSIEKDKLVEQRRTIVFASALVILLGILFFVIRFQAAKNRELVLVQEQQKANEEIYQLMLTQQDKIEDVRQLEKKRISQELHDGILGKLFGTRLNLGILNSVDTQQAVTDRSIFIDELKTIEQEIREISHDLNSEKTAIFNNFVVMVSNFIENQRTVCEAEIHFSMNENIDWNSQNNIVKINFYRILQESFQNINKYAGAKTVFASFEKTNHSLKLSIVDDGVGFNYSRKKKGIGLKNMESRITGSGGRMNIESEKGKGTKLEFEIPK